MTGIAKAVSALTNRAVLAASVGALIAIGAPVAVSAAPAGGHAYAQVREEIADRADELERFYAARDNRPLWFAPDGSATPAVERLLRRLDTAQFDALDDKTVKRLQTRSVRRDLDRAAGGKPASVAKAEIELSQLFAAYVRAMRAAPRADMRYESRALAPAVPTTEAALAAAAEAPSLDEYVADMGWMHPLYAPLRDALDSRSFSPDRRRAIWENLHRVRALPATPPERYVLVDAASARLWMYEDGKPVGSMKVVVGKPETPTPAMAGFIRYATVNPYWNVPPHLVRQTIAQGVLKGGTRYLARGGYEVLSDYSENAVLLDPRKVDWKSVAQGGPQPYVRQKPSKANFMGKVKYEFPNPAGIYLHDTPERALLKLDERQLSNGCVRLEDAERLGKFLIGRSVSKIPAGKEQRIDLPTLVPVYITYLTAIPTEQGIAFRDDVYGRDGGAQVAMGVD
jgi:murein L,D-transpeptidase YcbB/YkuD